MYYTKVSSFNANVMVEMAQILRKSVNYLLPKAEVPLCSHAPVCWFSIEFHHLLGALFISLET